MNGHTLWLSCLLASPQLLDAGTCPLKNAIWKLCQALEEDPYLGGVCGEIVVRSPRFWNFVESAQNFEYKMAHMLDKCGALVLAVVFGRELGNMRVVGLRVHVPV